MITDERDTNAAHRTGHGRVAAAGTISPIGPRARSSRSTWPARARWSRGCRRCRCAPAGSRTAGCDCHVPGRAVAVPGARGSLDTHVDLGRAGWNDIVVDGGGNAQVNAIGFDMMAGEEFKPGSVSLITADGSVRQVADDIVFPNRMAVTPDNSTLIVADSYRNSLVAFDIGKNGGLSSRRVWADLGAGTPDGICVDAQGAIWCPTCPTSRACASPTAARCCRPSRWTAAVSPARLAAPTGRRCLWWQPNGGRVRGGAGVARQRSGAHHPCRRAGCGLAMKSATGHDGSLDGLLVVPGACLRPPRPRRDAPTASGLSRKCRAGRSVDGALILAKLGGYRFVGR